jgi:uncharacterized protein YwgA
VYLLQCHPELKGTISFDYSLYFHGPYSTDLAREYYELDAVDEERIELSDKARRYIREVSRFGKRELELMATLALVRRYNRNTPDERIVGLVRELKPGYSIGEVREALSKLHSLVQEHGLDLYRQHA